MDKGTLESVPYFKGLKMEAQRFIEKNSTIKFYPKGKFIFFAEERCTKLYIVKEGLIKIFLLGDDGKEITIHYSGKGKFLGDTILFNEDPYGAHACAAEDSELIVIENRTLEKIISLYPEVGIKMLADFGKRLKRMMMVMGEIALSDVRKRLIRLIIELAKESCSDSNGKIVLKVPMKQDELASMIGTKREVLCRELHKLRREGLLAVARGKITINDMGRLRDKIYRTEGPVFSTTEFEAAHGGYRKAVS